MATSLKWMNRAGMIQRGKRIIEAHWRNRLIWIAHRNNMLESVLMDCWFDRHVAKYASFTTGRNVTKTDMNRVRNAFWRDAATLAEKDW